VQGRPIKDDPIVDFFFQISLNDVIETSRATVGFQRPPSKKKSGVQTEKDSDRRWSTEELIAMQLSYVKDLADSVSSVSSEKVKDVVVTVPPFYTQQERQALADAVEIAGLKLLAFISDGAAVAVNYAMTRTFEEKEIHVFYDAGATSITATVVAFSNPPGSKDRKVGSDIAILASAFNRNATGMELDRRMRDILVQEFTAKNPSKDIRTEKRALARLWKEAGRVKTILSANSEAVANVSSHCFGLLAIGLYLYQVESVAFDIDFKSKITRTQFENACSDLKWKFSEPVLEAVKKAGLTLVSSILTT
jgi:hypoxia up-regulated 1